MRVHLSVATVAILSILGSHSVVWGQGLNRSMSSSGLFGNRSVGGSVGPGSRSFGGGMNIAGSGDPFAGMTGAGGEMSGTERFLRQNRQPGQFIGRSGADAGFIGATSEATGMGGGAGSRMGSLSSLGGRGSNRFGNANRTGGGNRGGFAGGRGRRANVEVRTSLRVAFAYSAKAPTRVSTGLVERLARTPKIRAVSPLDVLVRGGTATLRGVVATDHDRDLAEQFVRLEAGIWTVKNELVVAAAPGEPNLTPPDTLPDAANPAVDTPGEPADR